jgi:hypothetical protein
VVAARGRLQSRLFGRFGGETGERAVERLRERAADEEDVRERAQRAAGSAIVTFSVTRPRPPGVELQTSFAPCVGQSGLRSTTCEKPSTNVGQRRTSVHRAQA